MSVLVSLFLLAAGFAHAQSDAKTDSFGFYLENDARLLGGPGTDQAYTSGIQFSYLAGEDHVPSWAADLIDRLPALRKQVEESKTNFGVTLGQQIFTPDNTDTSKFTKDDRPYAGWLYVGFSANFRTEARSQLFGISLGVVGPDSQAEEIQNEFHRAIGQPPAQGWKYQLANEPAVELSYQQRLKFYELTHRGRKYFDVVPYFGADFGNVSIAAAAGALARFGVGIPDDFGATRPSAADGDTFISPGADNPNASEKKLGYYVFAGGHIEGVLRNIFLDGNTFQSSPRVTKYPYVLESDLGFGCSWKSWSLIWHYVTRSPEFQEKSSFDSFASASLTYSVPSL